MNALEVLSTGDPQAAMDARDLPLPVLQQFLAVEALDKGLLPIGGLRRATKNRGLDAELP